MRTCRQSVAVIAACLSVFVAHDALAGLSFTSQQVKESTAIVVSGDFDYNDSLSEFSRLVDQTHPAFVTFDSPGGNPFKAMELGRAIRQKGLSTVQIRAFECDSACAFAFLGGVRRYAQPGSIGMHKTSFSNSQSMDVQSAVSGIQDAVADELSYLKEMGIDPNLLALAMTYDSNDIRYLSGSEMAQYQVVTSQDFGADLGGSSAADQSISKPMSQAAPLRASWPSYGWWIQLFSRQSQSEAQILAEKYKSLGNVFVFSYDNGWFVGALGPYPAIEASSVLQRLLGNSSVPDDSIIVSGSHFKDLVQGSPPTTAAPSISEPRVRAIDAANDFQTNWSLPNEAALAYLNSIYASQVTYFGKPMSKEEILSEKKQFAIRWPVRSYKIEPGVATAACTPTGICTVTGLVDWFAASPERNAKSAGTASFELVYSVGDRIELLSESSVVLSRQASGTLGH